MTSAADYYVRIRDYAAGAGAAAIVERGRQAGRDLGADPIAAIDALVDRALGDVDAAGDPLIEVIGGLRLRLSTYLPTRTWRHPTRCWRSRRPWRDASESASATARRCCWR